MWSKVPILGWLMSLFLNICSAIPFYFLWNNVGPKYFYQVPEVYQNLPFWDIVWIMMTISILKHTFFGGIFKTSVTNNNKDE